MEQGSVYKWMGFDYANFLIIWTLKGPTSLDNQETTVIYNLISKGLYL